MAGIRQCQCSPEVEEARGRARERQVAVQLLHHREVVQEVDVDPVEAKAQPLLLRLRFLDLVAVAADKGEKATLEREQSPVDPL